MSTTAAAVGGRSLLLLLERCCCSRVILLAIAGVCRALRNRIGNCWTGVGTACASGCYGDGLFADLFGPRGRPSVPGSVIAVVMVLQALEGCSDREAIERLRCDVALDHRR